MSQSKSLLQKSDKWEDVIRNHLLPSSFGITDVNLWCGKIETQTKRHKYFPWKMNIRLEGTFMLKKQAFDLVCNYFLHQSLRSSLYLSLFYASSNMFVFFVLFTSYRVSFFLTMDLVDADIFSQKKFQNHENF